MAIKTVNWYSRYEYINKIPNMPQQVWDNNSVGFNVGILK